jgi:hypothetical protein
MTRLEVCSGGFYFALGGTAPEHGRRRRGRFGSFNGGVVTGPALFPDGDRFSRDRFLECVPRGGGFRGRARCQVLLGGSDEPLHARRIPVLQERREYARKVG